MITVRSEQGCFGGTIGFYSHASAETGTEMKFSVYLPPQAKNGPVPAVYFLAGLTCTEETFMIKAGALRLAAELGLALPIINWENGGYKQIRDDMDARRIERVGVTGMNPDFALLAQACGCGAVQAESLAHFQAAVRTALSASRPTLLVVNEAAAWLS
jgi:hypothetical protein